MEQGLVSQGPSLDRSPSIIEALDRELNQYESLLSLLESRASSVMSFEEEDQRSVPEAAPVNELQRHVNRLSNLNAAMHRRILRIQV